MALLDGPYNLLDLLLFPTGFFLVLSLSYFDLPYLPLLFLCFLLLTLYQLRFSLSLASLARSALLGVLHLFFREVGTRGRHKLPSRGPILLACAPHINQFVDPITVLSITDRPVRFLCAAWSMRQPYIGDIARALNAIPVERAMDIATKGQGRVTVQGVTVTGDEGTDFVKQGVASGWSFLVKEESLTISAVTSPHTLTLAHPPDRGDIGHPTEYSVAPHIDQGAVFTNVWDALGAGECVGIFPEGGSHDQSAFLPFKAGVAIMALGAAAKSEGLKVQIFPVGLNYFQGWKFRSRVYLDIGDVIVPSAEQVAGYKAGGEQKKQAIADLLEQIHRSLKLVTATAPSYHILHLLWAIRRLYTPDDVRLSVTQKLELTRRLEQYYDRMKDTPEGRELQERVMRYNDQLAMLGLRDHQVKVATEDAHRILPLFLQRLGLLLALTLAALPGALLNAPTVVRRAPGQPAEGAPGHQREHGREAGGEGCDGDVEADGGRGADPPLPGRVPHRRCRAGVLHARRGVALRAGGVSAAAAADVRVGAVRGGRVGRVPLAQAAVVRAGGTRRSQGAEGGEAGAAAEDHQHGQHTTPPHIARPAIASYLYPSSLSHDERPLGALPQVNEYGPKLYGTQFEKERIIKQRKAGTEGWEGEQQQRAEAQDKDEGFEESHWIRLRSRKELGV